MGHVLNWNFQSQRGRTLNRIEFFFAGLLIVIGIMCLTMSGTLMMNQGMGEYLKMFTQICLWMGIPLILVSVSYVIYRKKRR